MKRHRIWWLLGVLLLSLCNCGMPAEMPEEMPEDFAFSLRWGTNGISSYHSEDGRLIKTTDVVERDAEEYVTALQLTEAQREEVYHILRSMKPETYPEEYRGGAGESDPPDVWELTIRYHDQKKRIFCPNMSDHGRVTPEGKRFLNACRAIRDLLIASPEWQALPDYEVFYD